MARDDSHDACSGARDVRNNAYDEGDCSYQIA